MALVAKFWSPIKDFIKSHSETPQVKVVTKTEKKPDPTKIVLKEAMLAQRSEIEACYDEYLRREPKNMNGSIAVKWALTAEGKVQSPSIADSEIEDSLLKDCVLNQVSQMTFDPNKFAENMQFSYRFHFKARAPGSVNFE